VAAFGPKDQCRPAAVGLGLQIGLGLDQAIDHAPVTNGKGGEKRFWEVFERNRGVAGVKVGAGLTPGRLETLP
jgi:hypothetical protein